MHPMRFPDLYRSIVLGTATSPGVVTLSGHDRNPSWDVAEAKGQEGASSTLNSDPVGQFQASFYLATPEEQLAWSAFQRVIESTTRGPKPKALPVYHPDLAANHFTEVCNAGVGGFVRDDRGGVTVLVKFIEYRPAKPKPASKASGGGGGGGASTPGGSSDDYDPNAALKEELDALLEEANTP